MKPIPEVIKPVFSLLLNRTRGNVRWFMEDVVMGDGEYRWTEAAIMFTNDEKQVCGEIARFNHN